MSHLSIFGQGVHVVVVQENAGVGAAEGRRTQTVLCRRPSDVGRLVAHYNLGGETGGDGDQWNGDA